MTVCAAVLVAGAAAAQETPSFPARDLPAAYDTYPRLSFHDVSLGYGVMPINDVTGIMDDLLPSLVGTGEIAKRKTGSVNMGYMYRLTPSLTVGGMFVYSGNMSSTVGIGYRGDQQAQAEGYDCVQDGHGNQQQQAAFYRNVQQEIG